MALLRNKNNQLVYVNKTETIIPESAKVLSYMNKFIYHYNDHIFVDGKSFCKFDKDILYFDYITYGEQYIFLIFTDNEIHLIGDERYSKKLNYEMPIKFAIFSNVSAHFHTENYSYGWVYKKDKLVIESIEKENDEEEEFLSITFENKNYQVCCYEENSDYCVVNLRIDCEERIKDPLNIIDISNFCVQYANGKIYSICAQKWFSSDYSLVEEIFS